jgi:hypothetical protein
MGDSSELHSHVIPIWFKSDPRSAPHFFYCRYTRNWRNPVWGHLPLIIKKLFVSPRPDRVRKMLPGQKSFLVKKVRYLFFFKLNLHHACFQCQHYTAEYDWSAYLRPSDATKMERILRCHPPLDWSTVFLPLSTPIPRSASWDLFQFWNMKNHPPTLDV